MHHGNKPTSEQKTEFFLCQFKKKLKQRDHQEISSDGLVVHSEDAIWLDSQATGNPSEIGILVDIPAKSLEFYLQKKYRQTAVQICSVMFMNRSIM